MRPPTRRPQGCPLCGSSRVICTHETTSVSLWRCQRCSLQWPTLDMEPVPDDAAAIGDAAARMRDQKT